MSPEERTRSLIADLLRKLRADADAAAAQVTAVEQVLAAGRRPDAATMALVSVSIDRAYTALEAAFARVAVDIDENLPKGEGWHKALLHQMTLAVQDRRPAVVSRAAADDLDLLRLHRHWLRHAYAAAFEWSRMEPAARILSAAVGKARADLDTFIRFLEQSE